jgi:hypothetical protein
LSSSARWQRGLHRAGSLVRPDFTLLLGLHLL